MDGPGSNRLNRRRFGVSLGLFLGCFLGRVLGALVGTLVGRLLLRLEGGELGVVARLDLVGDRFLPGGDGVVPRLGRGFAGFDRGVFGVAHAAFLRRCFRHRLHLDRIGFLLERSQGLIAREKLIGFLFGGFLGSGVGLLFRGRVGGLFRSVFGC